MHPKITLMPTSHSVAQDLLSPPCKALHPYLDSGSGFRSPLSGVSEHDSKGQETDQWIVTGSPQIPPRTDLKNTPSGY